MDYFLVFISFLVWFGDAHARRVTICIVIIQLCGHSVHNTTQHRSRPGTAKRVKLVEKGLPLSEEEQIKAQFPLKRSLEEISVG